MFDKIKVIGIGFAGAVAVGATTAAVEYAGEADWDGLGAFGPGLGLVIGSGLSWLLGYVKKETSGYGVGVPELDDEIPGGEPLPTGAAEA